MTQPKSIEVQVQDWLKANGHDLTEVNDIHRDAMLTYARKEVEAENARRIEAAQAQEAAKRHSKAKA